MDYGSIVNVVGVVGVGAGSYIGGRFTGRSASSQIAADTVTMLSAQIESLEAGKEARELDILDLTQRVAVLEGLVTQRAPVEALNVKVDLVKGVVDRIADRVGV